MALLSSDVVFGVSKLKDFSVGGYVFIRPNHLDDLVGVGIVSKVLSNGVYVKLPLTKTDESNGMKEVRITIRDLKIVSIEEFQVQGIQLISERSPEWAGLVPSEDIKEMMGYKEVPLPTEEKDQVDDEELQDCIYDLRQEHIWSVKTSLLYTLLDVLMSDNPSKQGKKSLNVADNLLLAAFPPSPAGMEFDSERAARVRQKEVVWAWYKEALALLSIGNQAKQLKKALEFQPKEDKNGMKRADRLALWLNVKMEVGEYGKVSSSTEFYPGTTKVDSYVIVLLSHSNYPEGNLPAEEGFGEGELVTPNIYMRPSQPFSTVARAIQARHEKIIKGELSSKYSFILPIFSI